MPLARVGARTDSTMRSANRGAWPISAHAHWHSTRQYAPRVLHFSAFHCQIRGKDNYRGMEEV